MVAVCAISKPSTRKVKPPRGFCTKISRAVSPSSHCYEHLVVTPNKLASRLASSSSSLSLSSSSKEKLGKEKIIETNNETENKNKRRQQASEEEGEDKQGEEEVDQFGEELVYVRLETLGTSIRDLNTRTINEKLLVGVFKKLLGSSSLSSSSSSSSWSSSSATENKQESEENFQMVANIRAQILGGGSLADGSQGSKLANKCRLSIERFLCRMVYPVCHFRRADVSALVRPPCREDCLLLRDVLCSNLDWSQFITVLNKAFNETLQSLLNINKLDLDFEEGAHDEELPSKIMQTRVKGQTYFNSLDTETRLKNSLSDYKKINPNSSIHLYWPHEHSIRKCEALPPLHKQSSSIEPTKTTSNTTTITYHKSNSSSNSHHYKFNGSRSTRARRRRFFMHNLTSSKWPVCSNAHLTATPWSGPLDFQMTTSGSGDTSTSSSLGEHKTISLSPSSFLPSAGRECLKSEDGIEYEGSMNITQSGLLCQDWTSQEPHAHKRNPGGVELKPWCYTRDPNVRWQFCNLPSCFLQTTFQNVK